jgi:nitrile hydratase subunit alpha
MSGDEALRAEVLEDLLVERGLLDREQVDRLIDRYANDIGPRNGAAVVARAWAEPDFRQRLLDDATSACAELGYRGPQGNLIAVENTESVHNVVVCTLCSCYPWPLLGLPPRWYKDPAYRSRVVREPRAVLAELGLELDPEVEIRVWDSSAEYRYVVLPERPAGTEGLDAEALADLVHRDDLIGVSRPTGLPRG